jgi:hypothetical protein
MSIIDMLIVNMVIASAGAQPAHPRHAAPAHRGDTIAHATRRRAGLQNDRAA